MGKIKIPKIGRLPIYFLIVIFIFILAVLQDFIYSRIYSTGFYLSESSLYNTFWLFFIPLTILLIRLLKRLNPNNKLGRLPLNLALGIAFGFCHLLMFTVFFVLISRLSFTPSHRFMNIFNSALTNQFYITLIWYIIFPIIYISKDKRTPITNLYSDKINLKIGSKISRINIDKIQYITTDKPYIVIHTHDKKLLVNKSLKELEKVLNPSVFRRVHRSSIINSTYVKELNSRNNGDYDAILCDGQIIRLSRHFKNNWKDLIQ